MKLHLAIGAAALFASATLLSPAAFAVDNGPCHYCDMEPIIVKGDRPKKKSVKQPNQLATQQTGVQSAVSGKR